MSAVITTFVPESSEPTAAIHRYKYGYGVAEKVAAFGEMVRKGGIFAGGVIFVGALVAFQVNAAEHSGFPTLSVLLIAGTVLCILIGHIWGVVFEVFGQMLKAAIDSAVNSSPFLSNAQRAIVMGLRKEPPAPDSISRVAA